LQPKQLKQVVQKIKKEWSINTSTETIKRIIKKKGMSWHRMRRGVGGKPDPIEYNEKKEKLLELKQLEDEEKIDLYYLDESGFCGIRGVPYGWQDIGEYLSIDSRRTKRLNVFANVNR